MRKNISKVIAAFKLGRPASGNSKKTCSTDGERIYSYALKIAERQDDGSIWIIPLAKADEESSKFTPSGRFGATTRAHIRAVTFELRAEPLEQVAKEKMVDIRCSERENREAACAE